MISFMLLCLGLVFLDFLQFVIVTCFGNDVETGEIRFEEFLEGG
jgi:hypothetical protein